MREEEWSLMGERRRSVNTAVKYGGLMGRKEEIPDDEWSVRGQVRCCERSNWRAMT